MFRKTKASSFERILLLPGCYFWRLEAVHGPSLTNGKMDGSADKATVGRSTSLHFDRQ